MFSFEFFMLHVFSLKRSSVKEAVKRICVYNECAVVLGHYQWGAPKIENFYIVK